VDAVRAAGAKSEPEFLVGGSAEHDLLKRGNPVTGTVERDHA
jgi:hypothetical protein